MDSRDSLLYTLIEDILTNFIEHTSPRERQLATDEIMTTIRLWIADHNAPASYMEELGRRVQGGS